MNINELRNEATKIANQAEALLKASTPENRAEKEAEFDRMMDDSDKLTDNADRLERAEARSREFNAIDTKIVAETVTVEGRGENTDAEVRAAVRAAYLRGEISDAELRAQSVGSTTGGGYTVADAPMAALVETLKTFGPMLNGSLVDMINTSGGNPLPIPTNDDTGNAPAGITAENAAISATDTVFGQKTLGAYKIASLFLASNELLADSSLNVEEYILRKLAERLARRANPFLTLGTGSSQPAGIVTGSSLGKTAVAQAAITADELIDLGYSVDALYADAGFMAHRTTVAAIRKLKDTTGQYLWGAPIERGAPATFDGKPVYINNDMDVLGAGKKVVLFGDFKKYCVRIAQGVNIVRLNERYADADQVGFRATMRVDGVVTDSTAIKHLITAA